jgi:hypothetical protein
MDQGLHGRDGARRGWTREASRHQRGQHLRGHPAHLGERLPHRGQRRRGSAGHRQVVEPDDTEVARHIEAGDPSRLDDAEGLLVAAGEDGGRRVGEREQVSDARVPAEVVEAALPDQLGVDRDTGGVESRAGSLRSGPGCRVGAGDRRSRRSGGVPVPAGVGSRRARPTSWSRPRWGPRGRAVHVGPARATQRPRAGGTMHVTGHPRPGHPLARCAEEGNDALGTTEPGRFLCCRS